MYSQEQVLKIVQEKNVEFLRLQFTDISGIVKNVAIPITQIGKALKSGIDLLRRIKKDENLRDIPVVILTGSNEDQDIQKSYDLGAGSYLVKPISNNALMLVIEKLFYP